MSRKTIQQAIQEQKDWIKSCGGTLDGYIRKYGRLGDYTPVLDNGKVVQCPDWSGNGGEAIYKADIEALKKLEKLATDKRRKYL